MKTLALLIFSTLVTSSFADGLNKDKDGNLISAHSNVDLNASQLEEIEALNSVTLTKTQWAKIRKVSPNTPKRLVGIVPISWNDCLCGTRCEAVLLKDNQLAVFHEAQKVKPLASNFNQNAKLTLMVDRRGQFYLRGILVHYNVLLEAIRASHEVSPEQRKIFQGGDAEVMVPPGMQITDPVFEDRIKTAYRELAAKGWNEGRLPYWMTEKD